MRQLRGQEGVLGPRAPACVGGPEGGGEGGHEVPGGAGLLLLLPAVARTPSVGPRVVGAEVAARGLEGLYRRRGRGSRGRGHGRGRLRRRRLPGQAGPLLPPPLGGRRKGLCAEGPRVLWGGGKVRILRQLLLLLPLLAVLSGLGSCRG